MHEITSPFNAALMSALELKLNHKPNVPYVRNSLTGVIRYVSQMCHLRSFNFGQINVTDPINYFLIPFLSKKSGDHVG
jgi:hypothetical protein